MAPPGPKGCDRQLRTLADAGHRNPAAADPFGVECLGTTGVILRARAMKPPYA